jgi:hypothetical protein
MSVRKSASNLISRVLSLSRRSGIRYAFTFRGFINLLYFLYSRKIRGHNSFSMGTNTYNYFDTFSKGGGSWYNERAVEIAIVMDMVRRYQGKNILEIGNVLSHYFTFKHDVCDKYEAAGGVITNDVVDFQSDKKYDLIISISTLEHVGWDESPRDSMKIPRSIRHLKTIGSKGGLIIITVPLGYNLDLDEILKHRQIQFAEQYQLIRISSGNEWEEAPWKDVQFAKYNSPYPFANALVIGIIRL